MAPSSPATASSHATASSDALSSLTRGTTAATSPAPMSPKSAVGSADGASASASGSRSPSLSPAPEEPPKAGTKRKAAARASDASTPAKKKTKAAAAASAKGTKAAAAKKGGAKATAATKKKTAAEEKPEKGTFCHQCRTRCEPENVLRCTKLRKYTKGTPARACNLAWCERDLTKRYAVDPDAVRERGHDVDAATAELHDADKPYVFACPCCEDTCQNSTCRQRKGLPALGDIVKLAAQQGVTPLELVAQADADGPTPIAKSRPQASELFDGDLSDPDAPPKKKKAAPKKAAAAPAKGKKATPKKDTKNGKTTKATAKAKTGKAAAAAEKPAAKGKAAKEKPKAPTRIVWPKTDPPAIRNVDTRLGREEAEQRMYLREFLCRFRGILNIPDRALGPLDDFDHPLSEATVRQMASAMLGAVMSDGGACLGMSVWNLDVIEDLREELRYADLSRFVQIFRQLEDELYGLTLPPDPTKEAKKRNEAAMRALLDLGADEPAPSWATDTGPSRRGRASASRLPQPSEVVRMLIGIADVVANLDEVRFHMDPKVLYSDSDAIRKLSQLHKKEATRWAEEKKRLNQARVLSKSAAGSKAAKARYEEAEEETNLRHRFYDLNYRTVAARKALRFEPLGTDLDGRVYYTLTPRLIDEERYRPSGWARGVFIWGRGWDQEDDDVPSIVERWMVVSSAKGVRQLADHIHWRLRIKEDEMAEAADKGAAPPAPAPAPAVEKTPAKMPNGRAKLANGKAKTALANGGDGGDGGGDDGASDAGSDDSELSAAPTEEYDDLLEHLNPPGYVPDAGTVSHEQFALYMGLTEVATFLRALEWKGH